ncbi:hypothetical protein GCM10025880_68630 [Methylorubrum aminovorans]|nr:DUF6448 family protein [Methylorubrum aminovorans]GMA80445.1 hypothetical protein GCM10025880_68630 [Methylorubrum aminovorans]
MTAENREHVEEVFTDLLETKDFEIADTEAGREYVEDYVTFTHLFEEGHEEEHDSQTEKYDTYEEEHDAHAEEVHQEETKGVVH